MCIGKYSLSERFFWSRNHLGVEWCNEWLFFLFQWQFSRYIMWHVPWGGKCKEFQMLAICHKSFCNVNHELVPYFKMLLQTILEKSEILSFSFDESLNEITQTSKIDLFVRFWDDTDNLSKWGTMVLHFLDKADIPTY